MTFLHAIFLAALAAAAIPILLHLLSRQRLPLIPFSSLEFLERLQKRKTRRVQLRQLILLALRTLAVAAVVLAFARPALRSHGATGSAAAVEMVIILDDGLASRAESRDGQLFRLALRRVGQLVELAGPNDRITLLQAARLQAPVITGQSSSELILSRLEETGPQYVAPDINRALSSADSTFAASDRFNRELYLVSGFYGAGWDSVEWEPSGEMVRRFLLPVGPQRLDNLSVNRVRLQSTILQRGRPVEIETALYNHSDRPVSGMLVSVYLDGERVAQSSVDLPPDAAVSRSFTVVPEQAGLTTGWVKFEDLDPLPADSRRYFILDVPDSLRVLAVTPDSVSRLVLTAALSGDRTGFVRLTWGDPTGWETGSLAGYDLLLLSALPSVSPGATRRVSEFVREGGGVIIFPGVDSDLAGLSRGLWGALGFAGARGTIEGGGVGWGKLDLQHPLFAGMFEKDGAPKSPSFDFLVDLAVGRGDQVVIPLSNGRPFLVERQIGRGRALLFAAPIGDSSQDFIYAGIFAPLVFRAAAYAPPAGREGFLAWETGQNQRVILPLPRAETARLELPNGDLIDLSPRPVVGGVEYEVTDVRLPGIYRLSALNRTAAVFAANTPTDQSNLVRCDLEDLSGRLGGAIIIDEDTEEIEQTIHSIRYGRELWRPITFAFILLLVSESLLGRAWRRESKEVIKGCN